MVIFRDPMLTVYSATRSGVTCVYVNVTQDNVLGIPNGVWVLLEYIQPQQCLTKNRPNHESGVEWAVHLPAAQVPGTEDLSPVISNEDIITGQVLEALASVHCDEAVEFLQAARESTSGPAQAQRFTCCTYTAARKCLNYERSVANGETTHLVYGSKVFQERTANGLREFARAWMHSEARMQFWNSRGCVREPRRAPPEPTAALRPARSRSGSG
jgi:hypothetical protein